MSVGRRSPGPRLQRIHFCGSDNLPDLTLCAVDFCGYEPAWACLRRAADAAAARGIPPMQTQHTSAQTRIRVQGSDPGILAVNSVINLFVTLLPNRGYGADLPQFTPINPFFGRGLMYN
jgi:hypothetical protein